MPGGLAEYLMGIVNAKNVPEIMASFKKIILSAYGIKSADGRRLEKEKNQQSIHGITGI